LRYPPAISPQLVSKRSSSPGRREESTSKVPVSVEAFDRDALQAKGITSIQDLSAMTPGIGFDTTGGFSPNTDTNTQHCHARHQLEHAN
jgi:outer membrane cobalamin receptor